MSIHFIGLFSLLCVGVFSINDDPSTEILLSLAISIFAGYFIYLVTYIYPIYRKWKLNQDNLLSDILDVLDRWEIIEIHIRKQSTNNKLDFTKVYQFSSSPFEPDDPYFWNDGERLFQDDLVRGIDSVRELMTRIAPVMDILPEKLSTALIELSANPWLNYKSRLAAQRKSFFKQIKNDNPIQSNEPNHLLHSYTLVDFSEILPIFFDKVRATKEIANEIKLSSWRQLMPNVRMYSLIGIFVGLILTVLFIPKLVGNIHENLNGSSVKLWLIAYISTVTISFALHFFAVVLGKVKLKRSFKWKWRYLLFIIISPDYLFADAFKGKFDRSEDRKTFIVLSNLLNILLMTTVLSAVHINPVYSAFIILFLGIRILSRGVEIGVAFTMDVIGKKAKSSSGLAPNQRVLLAFSSLLEVIISYALLHYLISLNKSEAADLLLSIFQSFSVSFFVESLEAFKNDQNIGYSFLIVSQIFISFTLIVFSVAKYIGDLNENSSENRINQNEEYQEPPQ